MHVFCLQQNLAFICFFQQDAHGLVFTRRVWSGLQISARRYKVSSAFTAWSISTVVELFSCKSMPCCIAFGQKIHATRLCFLERTCDGSLAEHSGGDTWSRNGCLEKCNASVNKNGTKQQVFSSHHGSFRGHKGTSEVLENCLGCGHADILFPNIQQHCIPADTRGHPFFKHLARYILRGQGRGGQRGLYVFCPRTVADSSRTPQKITWLVDYP